MAPGGQAVTQSLHLVQRSKNSPSATAPGGRNQSGRTAGTAASLGEASACLTNSCAALTVETTESFRKSRRPYEGLVAMGFLGGGSKRPSGKAAGDTRTAGVHSEVR